MNKIFGHAANRIRESVWHNTDDDEQKSSAVRTCSVIGVPAGIWFVICHHMVSLWCSPERCEACLHHHSDGCPSNGTQGVNCMQTVCAYLQLWQKERRALVALCFFDSQVWFGNEIQFPSLVENRCSRQLFFCPITLLVDWKWSQHLLTFLSGCERNWNAGEKRRNAVVKYECSTWDIPQIQLKEKFVFYSYILPVNC